MNEGQLALLLAVLATLTALGNTWLSRRVPSKDKQQDEETEIRKELRIENLALRDESFELRENNRKLDILNAETRRLADHEHQQNVQLLLEQEKCSKEREAWAVERERLDMRIKSLEDKLNKAALKIAGMGDENG